MSIVLGADLDQNFAILTDGKTPNKGDIFFGAGGKIYKFIEYEAGSAAVSGVKDEVAYYYQLDGYKNFIVSSDLSDSKPAGLNVAAGVLQAALADGEYGWIQIRGPATVALAFTAGGDGDCLTPTGSADGALDVSLVTNAGVYQHVCAIAGDHSDKEMICMFPF